MRVYWIKAQAPRRVLALVKHLGVKAEFVEVDMMAGGFKTVAQWYRLKMAREKLIR